MFVETWNLLLFMLFSENRQFRHLDYIASFDVLNENKLNLVRRILEFTLFGSLDSTILEIVILEVFV